eukprot:15195659-Alexandrium_andersonii.AAC.1
MADQSAASGPERIFQQSVEQSVQPPPPPPRRGRADRSARALRPAVHGEGRRGAQLPLQRRGESRPH